MHQNNSYNKNQSHLHPHQNQNQRRPNFPTRLQDKIFHAILHIGRINGQPVSINELNQCLQYLYGEKIRGESHPIFDDLPFRYLIRTIPKELSKLTELTPKKATNVWTSRFQLNIQIEDICPRGSYCENPKCRNLHFITKGLVYREFHLCEFPNNAPPCRLSTRLLHTYQKQGHMDPQVLCLLKSSLALFCGASGVVRVPPRVRVHRTHVRHGTD